MSRQGDVGPTSRVDRDGDLDSWPGRGTLALLPFAVTGAVLTRRRVVGGAILVGGLLGSISVRHAAGTRSLWPCRPDRASSHTDPAPVDVPGPRSRVR